MAGYYPFLVLVCVGAGWIAYVLFRTGLGLPRPLNVFLFMLALPFVGMVLDVLLALPALFEKMSQRDPFEFHVPPAWMEGLQTLVEDVAHDRGVDPPDDIRLHANSVAHVYEDRKGQTILVIGGVALAVFSDTALAGIIAHELGHFAAGDTGFSRLSLWWQKVMGRLEGRLLQRGGWSLLNPLTWLIRGYHLLYSLAWAADSRAQEYAADLHEEELVGAKLAASSLILISVTEQMPWVRLSSIAEGCVQAREPMQAIFAEQARRARAARPSEWEDACRRALKEKTGLFDSHPCLKERLRAMGVSPRQALALAVPSSDAPARELCRNWKLIEKLMTEKIMLLYHEAHQRKKEVAQIFLGR
jgi:Zn-dependent protease with chaperone function